MSEQEVRQRIRLAMAQKNIKQRELAKRAGMAESTICKWMLGYGSLGLVRFLRICEVLGLRIFQ